MTCPVQLCNDAIRAEVVPLSAVPPQWDMAWDALAAQASEANPFNERWFMRPAIAQLDTKADDRMIAVWQGHDRLVGMLPVTTAKRYSRLPVRHLENWLHYHCFFAAPLILKGHENAAWAQILDLLDRVAWAPGFLHLTGLDPAGAVYRSLAEVRRTDIVHRSQRAMLASDLSARDYYETHVRKKKRKELGRLRTRLEELGDVAFDRLTTDDSLETWIADFLQLEMSGWKGREGTALAAETSTRNFFVAAIEGGQNVGRLDMLRLTLDGKAIAMLINFLTPPGGYAFKIAFDEHYARFSPGVLLKIENLALLDRDDIAWMDSCAVEDHPMINSLWAERREIVRVTVPLAGWRRRAVFATARAIETGAARLRGRR